MVTAQESALVTDFESALGRYPAIFHSDQGCQFTSSNFLTRLQAEEFKISWSGRKRCFDNILVERLWRTVKSLLKNPAAPATMGQLPS